MAECSLNLGLLILQIVLYFVVLISGLMMSLGLGWVGSIFVGKCILHANMDMSITLQQITINSKNTEWGGAILCSFSTYSGIVIIIMSIIWIWFFVLLSNWAMHASREKLTSLPPDSRLLAPSLVLGILTFLCACISLGFIGTGFSAWCDSVQTSFQEQSCNYIEGIEWADYEGGKDVYRFLQVSLIGNGIMLGALALKIVVISIRISRYMKILGENGSLKPIFLGIHHSVSIEELENEEDCFEGSGNGVSLVPTVRVPSINAVARNALALRL